MNENFGNELTENENTNLETWIEDFLNELIDKTGLDLYVDDLVNSKENELEIGLTGSDSALAIGKDGQMLNSIQHIVLAAVNNKGLGRRKRIVIDVENYRKRREDRLYDNATQAAEEVLKTHNSIEMKPMSPADRRYVHMVVSKIEGVFTESSGTGLDRRVKIIPS